MNRTKEKPEKQTGLGYYLSPRTGARFHIGRNSQWGKELLADGWIWVEGK